MTPWSGACANNKVTVLTTSNKLVVQCLKMHKIRHLTFENSEVTCFIKDMSPYPRSHWHTYSVRVNLLKHVLLNTPFPNWPDKCYQRPYNNICPHPGLLINLGLCHSVIHWNICTRDLSLLKTKSENASANRASERANTHRGAG